jgi:hypothetical protein
MNNIMLHIDAKEYLDNKHKIDEGDKGRMLKL